MESNKEKLSDFIDRLNAERKPDENEYTTDSPELEELYQTVKLVRSLRDPAMPEGDFPHKLAHTLEASQKQPHKKKVWPWFAGIASAAAILLIMANLFLPTNTNIVSAMEKAFQEVQAYHGVIEIVEKNADGDSVTQSKLEVWANKDGSYYTRGLEGVSKDIVTVNNGEKKWQVRPNEKQVHVLPEFPDPYRFAFELGQEMSQIKNALSIKEIGEEKIAGRNTLVLEVIPEGGEAYKIWVDKQSKLPLQKQSPMMNGIQYKMAYIEIEFRADIPAELTAFHVPEGFEEINNNAEQTISNFAEAEMIVGFIPTVSGTIPAGYSLDRVAVVSDHKLAKLYYSNQDQRFLFIQGKAKGEFEPASTAILGKINGHTAEIQSPIEGNLGILAGGGLYAGSTDLSSIRWQEDDFEYAILSNTSQEDLIAFTEKWTNGKIEIPQTGDHNPATPEEEVLVDLEIEKNDQKSVDSGSSPWKLDPAFVAQVFVSLKISPDGITGDYPITEEELQILQNDGTTAIVKINNNDSPITKVYLKKLVRQDPTGIWTVVGYDTRK